MNDVVGRIEQLTETAKPGVSIGGPAGAALVMADKYDKRIAELEAKLRRCRKIMECNDPINARDIFGPPAATSPRPAIERPGYSPGSDNY